MNTSFFSFIKDEQKHLCIHVGMTSELVPWGLSKRVLILTENLHVDLV